MSLTIQADFSEQLHSRIVLGQDDSFPRGRAISMLAEGSRPDALSLLKQVLANTAEEPRFRRLAAIALWRLNTAEAREILLASLEEAKDPTLLDGLAKVLGRVGDERALKALEAARDRADGYLAEHIDFAASLIAHRLGLAGHDLAVPQATEGVPRSPRGRLELSPPSQEELDLFFKAVEQDPYDVALAKGKVWQIRCPAGLWMLALSERFAASSIDGLRQEKTVAGLIASKNNVDGRYSIAYLLFSSGDSQGKAVNLLIHRTTGEAAWAGTLQEGPDGQMEFSIHTVGRTGIVAIEVAGNWTKGGEIELSRGISSTRVAAKQNPIAFEGKAF